MNKTLSIVGRHPRYCLDTNLTFFGVSDLSGQFASLTDVGKRIRFKALHLEPDAAQQTRGGSCLQYLVQNQVPFSNPTRSADQSSRKKVLVYFFTLPVLYLTRGTRHDFNQGNTEKSIGTKRDSEIVLFETYLRKWSCLRITKHMINMLTFQEALKTRPFCTHFRLTWMFDLEKKAVSLHISSGPDNCRLNGLFFSKRYCRKLNLPYTRARRTRLIFRIYACMV